MPTARPQGFGMQTRQSEWPCSGKNSSPELHCTFPVRHGSVKVRRHKQCAFRLQATMVSCLNAKMEQLFGCHGPHFSSRSHTSSKHVSISAHHMTGCGICGRPSCVAMLGKGFGCAPRTWKRSSCQLDWPLHFVRYTFCRQDSKPDLCLQNDHT